MVGKSTAGKAATASRRYPNKPKTINDAVISVVITGRRMQVSEIFTSRPRLALAHRDPRPVGEQQVSVGDHDVAIIETGFDDRFGAQQPRHLDRRDGGDVILHHEHEVALLAD